MSTEWIISAFILGLGGSLHCLGMCGPLILMMPFKSKDGSMTVLHMTLYFAAKALMYGCLGLFIGFFGLGLRWLMGQYVLSFLAGSFILGIIFWPMLSKWLTWPARMHEKIMHWYQILKDNPRWYYFIALGMLNALLPCVMILVATGASVATAHPMHGFLFMMVFGIGTAPALIVAYLSQDLIKKKLRFELQWTSKVIAILLGVILVIRGLNLEIPHSHHPVLNQVSKFITCKVPE